MRGYAPNLRELFKILGYSSTNSTTTYLHSLRDAGLVSWVPRRSRTLTLTEAGWRKVLGDGCAKEKLCVNENVKELLRGQLNDDDDGEG